MDLTAIARDSGAVRLVPTHNPVEVAEAIRDLIDKQETRDEMGRAGLRYAASSTWSDQAAKLFAFIDRVLADR